MGSSGSEASCDEICSKMAGGMSTFLACTSVFRSTMGAVDDDDDDFLFEMVAGSYMFSVVSSDTVYPPSTTVRVSVTEVIGVLAGAVMVGLSEFTSLKVTVLTGDCVQVYVWSVSPSGSSTVGFVETDDPRATRSGPPA